MKKPENSKLLESGLLAGLRMGTVSVPHGLLQHYPKLKLTDMEAMVLIQLMAFVEKEKKDFPTVDEIQARMSAVPEQVIKALQKLLKEGFISIDEEVDAHSGIQSERYNLDGLLMKLAGVWADDIKVQTEIHSPTPSPVPGDDVFSVFESEFARPLTPMELETITGWLDKDGYKVELIVTALKEAVFAGKLHFRYVDRILLDWSRNRVYTVEQAKEHSQKFRGNR